MAKTFRKAAKSFFLGLIVTVCVSGCGANGTENNASPMRAEGQNAGQKDYVYIAETEEFINKNFIQGICSYEDKLYITTYNEEDRKNQTYVIDCLTKETKPLFLPLEETGESEIQTITTFDGNLFFIEKLTETTETGEEKNSYFIKSCDAERCELISRIEITSVLEDYMVSSFTMDVEGNFYLASGKTILVLDSQGSLLFEAHPNIKWFLDINKTAEGEPVFLAADVEDGLCLGVIDVGKKGLGKVYKGIPGGNTNGGVSAGLETELYLSCNGRVYDYDVNNGSYEEEFRWSESNLLSEEVRYFVRLSDGNFVAVLSKQKKEDYDTRIAYLAKTPRSEADMRTVLVLGTLQEGEWAQSVVNYFNSVNSDYRVEVKSYYGNELQLQLDLVSGEGPDILDVTGLDVSQLEAKGLIEDLNPYLSTDDELKNVEFVSSVCKANTINGKLLCLPPYFEIRTVFGRVSEFGTEGGLTTEELYKCIEEKKDDRRAFSTNQNLLLRMLLSQSFPQFIDWDSGECHLNSEEFIELLEFSKAYGMTEETEQRLIEEIDDGGRYEAAMLEIGYMQNALSIKSESTGFGEEVVCIGHPIPKGADGNGSAIENLYAFLMCASSEHKDGVWSFLRSFLTTDYYNLLLEEEPGNIPFPVRKDILELAFDKWMGTHEFGDFNGQRHLATFTQDDRDYVMGLIESTDVLSNYNYAIFEIMEEETQAFYMGQKSAGEVAEIIQNRVQLYVNEQR